MVTPIRSGVMRGLTSAVTTSSSSTAASCSENSTAVESDRLTLTPVTSWVSKPSIEAVSVYGPPGRTFWIAQRPSFRLTVLYRVPVGVWTAVTTAPGSAEPSSAARTCPVRVPVVAPWANRDGAATTAAHRARIAQIEARETVFMLVSPSRFG